MQFAETLLFYDTQEEKPIIYGFSDDPIYKGRHVFIDKSISVPVGSAELTFVKNVFFTDESDLDENGEVKKELIEQVEERRYLLKFEDIPIYPEVLFNSIMEHEGYFNVNEWCLAKITVAPSIYGKCYIKACFGVTLLDFINTEGHNDDNLQVPLKALMKEKGGSNDVG